MLFDTDVLIWFLRGNENAADLLQSEPLRLMSQVSWMELVQGAYNKRELAHFKSSISRLGFELIPLGGDIGNRAVAYMEQHSLKDGVMLADALIGATAMEYNLTLATANVKHFRCLEGVAIHKFRP